jgi:hypothetical protein
MATTLEQEQGQPVALLGGQQGELVDQLAGVTLERVDGERAATVGGKVGAVRVVAAKRGLAGAATPTGSIEGHGGEPFGHAEMEAAARCPSPTWVPSAMLRRFHAAGPCQQPLLPTRVARHGGYTSAARTVARMLDHYPRFGSILTDAGSK